MMRGRSLTIALAALLATGSAMAQDSITGVSMEVHVTFHNVGVTVVVTGDENRDATADLELDIAGAGFVAAHPLSRTADDRFVGSALALDDGTSFELRVTLTDPDGVTNGTLSAQGATRTLQVPQSTGSSWHVATGGSDSADGSETTPFATVARGLQQAQAGDTVEVHAGVYHEEITLDHGGTAGAPITLRAAGDGDAVLDGADPDLKDPGAWTDEGGSVHSAPHTETRYVAVDGVRLWRYESLGDLQSLSEGTDGGFHSDGDRIYVRLPNDATPAGHEIQVSELGRALWLEGASNIVVRGLIIRCYGAETYSQGMMVDLNNVAPGSEWMVRAMKFNVGDERPSGDIFAYHNTATTTEADQAAFTVTDDSRWSTLHLRNNIWVGSDHAFYFSNTGDEPFTHDYDLLYSTGDRLVYYQGSNYDTLAEYTAAAGHCSHCLDADPLFVDSATGDYALQETSPAVDQGVVIPGINDDYLDAGPDMGALEYGEEPKWPDDDDAADDDTSDDDDTSGDDDDTSGDDDGGDTGCECRSAPGAVRIPVRLLLLLGAVLLRRR